MYAGALLLLPRKSGPAPCRGSQFQVEGEVLDLRRPTIKAIFIAAFFGFTLGSSTDEPAASAHAVDASAPAPPSLPLPSASAPASDAANGCPRPNMILVDGDYCPDAEQVCLKWLDPPPYQNLRCGEYQKPAKCRVAKVHKRFCIDRE